MVANLSEQALRFCYTYTTYIRALYLRNLAFRGMGGWTRSAGTDIPMVAQLPEALEELSSLDRLQHRPPLIVSLICTCATFTSFGFSCVAVGDAEHHETQTIALAQALQASQGSLRRLVLRFESLGRTYSRSHDFPKRSAIIRILRLSASLEQLDLQGMRCDATVITNLLVQKLKSVFLKGLEEAVSPATDKDYEKLCKKYDGHSSSI